MFKNYTISIVKNNESGVPPFSAYCKELDITTDDFSIPEVLSALFSAIKIIEDEQKVGIPKFKSKARIDFKIPVAI
jgi:hypothetical protein